MYSIDNLLEYLPYCYRNELIEEILRCSQIEIERLFQDIIESENEYMVSTATYSLEWWAKFAGIDYDRTVDISTTRSNILARFKTNETVTPLLIKSIAEGYSNGTCEVIELFSEYRFKIKFISTVGIPLRIDEIKKIINDIRPAHLAFDFDYRFRTWGDIKRLGLTWGQWKALNRTYKELKERSDLL
ncbi:putative phage tail protein [Peptostreptococcus equinus]|uniref:DUF2313 domain-containing protein n=1 Tax=Peptostreptococcus equinus TaxID=3003601 RepID=A0ABY7JMZ1_9FIRM|nr:putative phage tail protein [Peptostreptococcus sp. CBA3647]WAW14740.1 DUF2313 domain-containing protein [Peptostreptococcus sp. CBA3647]